MQTFRSIVALVLIVSLAWPAASAAGALVRVHVAAAPPVETGLRNPAGGQGEFVDVGVANDQCNDEDDVVDVGVVNREGHPGKEGCDDSCQDSENVIVLGPHVPEIEGAFGQLRGSGTAKAPHCSDDGDALDVGVGNQEGTPERVLDSGDPNFSQEGAFCDAADAANNHNAQTPSYYGGDYGDGVDVGVFNDERCDDADAVDLGVGNCEASDANDRVDVGLANMESYRDQGDTADVGVTNVEADDHPDWNGIEIRPVTAFFTCPLPARLWDTAFHLVEAETGIPARPYPIPSKAPAGPIV